MARQHLEIACSHVADVPGGIGVFNQKFERQSV
jgi:hypothetical protein